jgi:hypothetical protein
MKKYLVVLLASLLATAAHATEGGLGNYVPAFYGDLGLATEPPDGLSIRYDQFYYSGDIARSFRGGVIRADVEATTVYSYLSILYKPSWELFGTPMAFAVTPSIGQVDVEAGVQVGGLAAEASDKHTGLGDTTFSAMIYWDYEKYHFSLNGFMVTPTGDYSKDDLANTGLNYWTFEADVAATYLNEESGQDYSIVLGYGYNTENKDTNYQSGDEIHADFVFNQFLTESFAVGVNGYVYKQIGDDRGDGALLGSFKGEGAGIGPAVYFTKTIANKEVYFIAKWVHDVHAENRLEGDYVYASFALSF